MGSNLGRWALIDIETTGIDPANDSIIDVGFLEFEGTKLVRDYSSLVQYEHKLSHFIQKLTGITTEMVRNAPNWNTVSGEVLELMGCSLLAHNADFEKGFLKEHFDRIADEYERESYEDSMYYLALLLPGRSVFKLESFITEWKIRDHEIHRGYEDSVDLLKVLLVATCLAKKDHPLKQKLSYLFDEYRMQDFWYSKFFNLSNDDLYEIADQIEFDLEDKLEEIASVEQKEKEISNYNSDFSREFTGENIKKVLESEEQIQKLIPQYKLRKTQLDLANKVGQSFKNNIHALVQAPTGTGKTFGYLLPSVLYALNSEEGQVLVSTGTKTLQNQIMKKDVPIIRKILGLREDDLKIRYLVGSGNHYCELLFRQMLEENEALPIEEDFEESFSNMYLDLLFFHNSRAGSDEVMTRDDFPYVIKRSFKKLSKLEKEIAVDFRSCAGRKCPFSGECSYLKGLREAKEASIIVGNHALMFSWPKSFKRPSHIIVDEAHKIEGEVSRACTYQVTKDSLFQVKQSLENLQGIGSLFYLLAKNESQHGEATETINQIRELVLDQAEMLKEHLEDIGELIERYFKKRPRFTDLYWNESPMISARDNDALSLSVRNHMESMANTIKEAYKGVTPYFNKWDINQFDDEKDILAFSRFEKFVGLLEDHVLAFANIMGDDEDFALSIRYHEEFGYEFLAAPINVGEVVHSQLLETSASVVYTSATLGNALGDQGSKGIEWATGYLYLDPKKRFRSGFYLPAVYDYEKKTRVYVCDDTPPLYQKDFVLTSLTPIMKLIREINGRSLLLFSARTRFEMAREILLDEFEGEIPLFIQGMGNSIVEEFKKSKMGILLGMESFGEGIDIPGDTLQFIFIDKIPDLRQDLVINKRRDFFEREIGNEFTDYYLSHRTRSLHQKLGRLLRTEHDFGGVIVVDSRIKKWKKSTFDKMTHLMKPYNIERTNLADACQGVKDFILTQDY